jgi:hypothetical protein
VLLATLLTPKLDGVRFTTVPNPAGNPLLLRSVNTTVGDVLMVAKK